MSRSRLRVLLLTALAGTGAMLVVVAACNAWVVLSTRQGIYANASGIPQNAVGLLLGTSPRTRGGGFNPYFRNRMRAAVELYRAGRIRHLLVSGANPSRYYNEPRAMFEALVAHGVPPAAITLDFAGFRTLDSVVRAKRVFGQTSVTIISQRFHDYRALFIARHRGLQAVAFAAAPVRAHEALWARTREVFARVRAVLDLFVLHAQPRFLGDPVDISLAPAPLNPDRPAPAP